MRKQVCATISAGILLAVAGSAQAVSTKTTNFGVSATVAPNCLISAGDLAFGNYFGDPDAPVNVDASANISVRCSKNAAFSLALSGGSNGTIAQRLMAGPGGDTLQYNLFSDANRTTLWGDGTTGSTVDGTGTGMANTLTKTVYGRLPDNAHNQAAGVGAYTDTVTVTVTY